MSQENLKRRDFIKGAATAGLSAPLLVGENFAEASRQNQLSALGQARPVVIASANGANVPKSGVEPRGVSCVERAMQMLKSGGD
ncbi:MAG: twin-arginine translocation signal domain-containing protein, partial [Blastocatellia bacterium]